jgi:isocitrate dehydrogenase
MSEAQFPWPTQGTPLTMGANGKLNVPVDPIIPFIEGDGTGPDIWRASRARARRGRGQGLRRQAQDFLVEVFAGEKSFTSSTTGCPDDTVKAFREFLVGIKGPLTTPVGGGIRSLNVALRQMLDLYVCLRPVQWFTGVPSPGEAAGEGEHGHLPREHRGHLRGHRIRGRHRGSQKILAFLKETFPKQFAKIRFPTAPCIGIKPVSKDGTDRLMRAAIEYALDNKRKSVTVVHKGNIMKYTEGAFMKWAYALAEKRFRPTPGAVEIDQGGEG